MQDQQTNTREQMVEKVARVIAELEPGEDWPSNDALGGHWALGTRDDEFRHAALDQARSILDAVLPQVSTVDELEALPESAVIVDQIGVLWWRGHDSQHWWGMTHKGWSHADLLQRGSLTVVWTPPTT
jgi:hypothetical protein